MVFTLDIKFNFSSIPTRNEVAALIKHFIGKGNITRIMERGFVKPTHIIL